MERVGLGESRWGRVALDTGGAEARGEFNTLRERKAVAQALQDAAGERDEAELGARYQLRSALEVALEAAKRRAILAWRFSSFSACRMRSFVA